ncbi:replication initiator protein A [Paludisphaera rhizosphaerae]|uniref:replication initiator protein A n=1 Tax=Paludisphaera rhizosphaerae TaxID=2711216 RepID=UPI0013ECE0A6|nr:replication initiator protein A [Paludisphaera rhizosphaerae]
METPPEHDQHDPREAIRASFGRDELNLAEFPITLLSDRVPKGCKTLVFEIGARDSDSQPARRKVTITGGDAYGLPTAIDDEVLVALIQLTKLRNDFTSPKVSFSRYELVRILGWPDDGKSYRRIQEAINRWAGVTLYYDNAWYNKETGTMVSETFHIIERATFVDEATKRVRRSMGQPELALSSFSWNEVVFRSFQAGSLKRLDIDAYFSFSTSIAKRMYRFLDKRFWVKPCWEFDLKDFAFEHIGLSRKYNVGQIKNKLLPAIEELSHATKERAAFIEPMGLEERYAKVGKGQWLIRFERKVGASLPADVPLENPQEPRGLVAELVSRGVAAEVAEELVRTRPPELITLRLEVLEWVLSQKNQKIIKESPTGYLVSSIRDRYLAVPKGFESKAEREKRLAAERLKREQEHEGARLRMEAKRREDDLERRLSQRWEAMTPDERASLEAKALAEAGEEARQQLEATPKFRSMLMTPIRKDYLRRLIEREEASTNRQVRQTSQDG